MLGDKEVIREFQIGIIFKKKKIYEHVYVQMVLKKALNDEHLQKGGDVE